MGAVSSNFFKEDSVLKKNEKKSLKLGMPSRNPDLLSSESAAVDKKKRHIPEEWERGVKEVLPDKKPKEIGDQLKNTTTDEEPKILIGGDLLQGDAGHSSTSATNTPGQGVLSLSESVPDSHKYKRRTFQPKDPSAFSRIVMKELSILKSSLPDGIVVKSFEDRIDLFSVMVKGPKGTPYEDGLFFFEVNLPPLYPKSPPFCHYVSYCKGRLNPNLYEGGRICISLLGTWPGSGTQKWNKDRSNLLQLAVSIQGLILVSEPYYNEPGYERLKGTPNGDEKSRAYNGKVLLKVVNSMTKLAMNPPELFRREIFEHVRTTSLAQRLERWLVTSESLLASSSSAKSPQKVIGPEFPLFPASKGFSPSLMKSIVEFKKIQQNVCPQPKKLM